MNVAILQVFILLQVLERTVATGPCNVSLEDGLYRWYGTVRVGADNAMICDSSWNINTAKVICRQLGYTGVIDYTSLSVSESVMGYSGFVCEGNEPTLCGCNLYNPMSTTCPEGSVGRVVCKVEEEQNLMELVGGNFPWEGTAVLTVNGVKGTLCSDFVDINVASVICRQLGFSKALHIFIRSKYESGVMGPKWLESIDCNGNEDSILLCSHSGIGQVQSCDSPKNLGVICDGGLSVDTVPVRLTGGADYEGILEVFYTGIWETVCNRHWTWKDANVVCTQLGYGPPVRKTSEAFYESTEASGVILTTRFGCNGDEQHLTQCPNINWNFTDCSVFEILKVKCSELKPLPNYIRLADGGTGFFKNVEIFMGGVWGSVCANNWDRNDGNVICQQLGFVGVNEVTSTQTIIDGTQVAWIDDVACDGSENDLRDCQFTRKNSGVCDGGRVASLICNSTLAEGSLRLSGGQSPEEGTVDILKQNMWMPICGNNWGRKNGDIVCRELGYLRSFTASATLSIPQKSISINCNGNESSLSLCPELVVSECMEHASVVCTDEPENPVRLQGNNESEGRVEVFYKGTWGTICDSNWNKEAVDVVCRQLGFSGDRLLINEYPANELTPIWLTSVSCRGNEVMLSECDLGPYGLHECESGHGIDAGVVCKVDEDSRPIRLVGGTAISEGRLELFHEGTWGSICNNGFGMPDAIVACRKLGFTGLIEVAEEGQYGVSEGPILLKDIGCSGNEASLDECDSSPGTGCMRREDVGIVCDTTPGMEGDIRLLNDVLSQPNSGRVEIFHDSFWGGICDKTWLHSDAEVVCRQLGFPGGSVEEEGERSSTIGWLDSVSCNGSEERLEDCSHGEWKLNSPCFNVEVICEVPPEPTPTLELPEPTPTLSPEVNSSSFHLANPTRTYTPTSQSPGPSAEANSLPVIAIAVATVASSTVVLFIAVLLVVIAISRWTHIGRTSPGRTMVGDKSTISASTEEQGEKWAISQGISNKLFDVSESTEYPLKPQTLSLKTDAEGYCSDPLTPTHHIEVSM